MTPVRPPPQIALSVSRVRTPDALVDAWVDTPVDTHKRRAFVGTVLTLGLASSLPMLRYARAASAPDTQLLATILSSIAATPLRRAPFHAKKTSGLLAEPVESRGTLSFDASGAIEKHTLTPIDERITITELAVRIERAGKPAEEIRVADNPALAAYARGLRAVLAGDPAPLREHFDVAPAGSLSNWTLELRPKSARLQTAVRSLVVGGSGGLVKNIETTDGAGDVETLTVLLTPESGRPR